MYQYEFQTQEQPAHKGIAWLSNDNKKGYEEEQESIILEMQNMREDNYNMNEQFANIKTQYEKL